MRVTSGIRFASCGLLACVLALPAAALARSAGATGPTGGATAPNAGGAPGATGTTGPLSPLPTAGTLTVAPSPVAIGQVTSASGVLAAAAGRRVRMQIATRRGWSTVARGLAGADGSFALSWIARRSGELTVRVVSAAGASTDASTASGALDETPEATLAVYKPVIATWYGPGFYGRHTACGEVMSRWIVGVADRSLRCGTPVSVSYQGRTLVVPVIDRGPYGGQATLDLTHGAALELGITETVPVEMIALTGPALAPSYWDPPGSGASGATSIAGGATAPPASSTPGG